MDSLSWSSESRSVSSTSSLLARPDCSWRMAELMCDPTPSCMSRRIARALGHALLLARQDFELAVAFRELEFLVCHALAQRGQQVTCLGAHGAKPCDRDIAQRQAEQRCEITY